MHLLFVDESGTPPKPGKSTSGYFVVGAIAIPEHLWHRLRDALFGMKVRRGIRGEFKWRYFAPKNDDAKSRRAERLDGDQPELGLEDLGADIARAEQLLPVVLTAKEPEVQDRPGRPSLPEHLEREDVNLDLDMTACPCCGGALHAIGETVSEMLDWVPARLRVIRFRWLDGRTIRCRSAPSATAFEKDLYERRRISTFLPLSHFTTRHQLAVVREHDAVDWRRTA